ncbi:MAG: LysM domain-containing protein [Myxococcales bacterium]|nr:MAG: LysM domain-containing protein [Myxococcales bacterium]
MKFVGAMLEAEESCERFGIRQYGPPERKEARDGATAQNLLASTREPARPSTHTVFAGQRLESIAKRYQVSIDALCDVSS